MPFAEATLASLRNTMTSPRFPVAFASPRKSRAKAGWRSTQRTCPPGSSGTSFGPATGRQAPHASERAVVLDACLPRSRAGLGELGPEVSGLVEVNLIRRAPAEEAVAPTSC